MSKTLQRRIPGELNTVRGRRGYGGRDDLPRRMNCAFWFDMQLITVRTAATPDTVSEAFMRASSLTTAWPSLNQTTESNQPERGADRTIISASNDLMIQNPTGIDFSVFTPSTGAFSVYFYYDAWTAATTRQIMGTRILGNTGTEMGWSIGVLGGRLRHAVEDRDWETR